MSLDSASPLGVPLDGDCHDRDGFAEPGPGDLGLTMGILPSEWNDEHTAMIQHILDKCIEHGVPWGMFTSTYEIAEYWLERGGLIDTVGADMGFLMSGLADMDARVRDLVARINAG